MNSDEHIFALILGSLGLAIVVILGALLFKTGTSMQSTSTALQASAQPVTPGQPLECLGSFYGDGLVNCFGFVSVSNPGTVPVSLTGTPYVVLNDGRVFASDASEVPEALEYVTTSINPGDSAQGTFAFRLPEGSTVTRFFIADTPTSTPKVVLPINQTVTAG